MSELRVAAISAPAAAANSGVSPRTLGSASTRSPRCQQQLRQTHRATAVRTCGAGDGAPGATPWGLCH